MEIENTKFTNQLVIPSTDFKYNAPRTGVLQGGVLSAASFFVSIAFSIMIAVWVGLTMLAAFRIISGQGSQESREKGIKIIRNIWVGITSLVVFFAVISMVGVLIGFGSIYDWSTNLQQCPGSGSFYFSALENGKAKLEEEGIPPKAAAIFCCPTSETLVDVGGWEVIGVNNPDSTYNFEDCEFFGAEEI